MNYLKYSGYRFDEQLGGKALEIRLKRARKQGHKIVNGDVRIFNIKIKDVIEVEDEAGQKHWYKKEKEPNGLEKAVASLFKCKIYSGGMQEWERSIDPRLRILLH